MGEQDVFHHHRPDAGHRPGDESGSAPGNELQGLAGRNGEAAPTGRGEAARLRSEFADRVATARERFAATVDEVRRAADVMETDGRPPSYRLVYALGECHRAFQRLRLDLTRRIEAIGLPVPAPDSLEGISDLVRLIDALADDEPTAAVETAPPAAAVGEVPEPQPDAHSETVEPPAPTPVNGSDAALPSPGEFPGADHPEKAESPPAPDPDETTEPPPDHPGESVRSAALAVIGSVLGLATRDGSEFPPLKECQAQALALRETIAASPASALPDEAEAIARGEHAFGDLLTVVSGVESLGDAEWAAVHARVSEAFGRPLAVAAARGRFQFRT